MRKIWLRYTPISAAITFVCILLLSFYGNRELIESNRAKKYFSHKPDLAKARNTFSFDDPKVYIGPYLEGWPPNASRDVSLLVKPNANTIINDVSCLRINGRFLQL